MCRYTHDVPKVTIIHLAFLKAEDNGSVARLRPDCMSGPYRVGIPRDYVAVRENPAVRQKVYRIGYGRRVIEHTERIGAYPVALFRKSAPHLCGKTRSQRQYPGIPGHSFRPSFYFDGSPIAFFMHC